MSSHETKMLSQGLLPSSGKGTPIPIRGLYQNDGYKENLSQKLNVGANWGLVEPLSPFGVITFDESYLQHLRIVITRLMRDKDESDAAVQAVWKRLPPQRWPARGTWLDWLEYMEVEDLKLLASDSRIRLSFDPLGGSSHSTPGAGAPSVSSASTAGRKWEEERKKLEEEMLDASKELEG